MGEIVSLAMNEFNQNKKENKRLNMSVKRTIYGDIPELLEIDHNITLCKVKLLRRFISGKPAHERKTAEKEIEEYSTRRKKILNEKGLYDEESVFACSFCHDCGYVDGRPCKCLKKLMKKWAFQKSGLSLNSSNITFKNSNWQLFENSPYWEQTKVNYKEGFKFACLEAEFKNLLIKGNVGTGKTYLSNCVANKAISNGTEVNFKSSYELFEIARECKSDRKDKKYTASDFGRLYNSKMLFIDDLGSENVTPFVVCELLNLINIRFVRNLYTLVNTNLTDLEIRNVYGTRVHSRLVGSGRVLDFVGRDLRLSKQG